MTRARVRVLLCAWAIGLAGVPLGAMSGEKKDGGDVETFCKAVSDVVREREFEQRKQELEALKAEINGRIETLEALKAEVTDWQRKREDFAVKARASLVEIYTTMKPDAAAAQLGQLDSGLAAAILMKMETRKAGLVLAEMTTEKAAQVASIIAAAANTDKRS